VKEAPLLILDDLGTQSSTPWAQEKLFQLINHRYTAQLPTVVTTNLPLEELGERLRTRLGDPNLSQVFLVEARAMAATAGWEGLDLLHRMTFDNFDWKRVGLSPQQRHSLEVAYHRAHAFAQAPDGWLVLMGGNGCGKTHLAAAIANYRLGQGQPALFIIVPDLLDHLRSTFSPQSHTSYDELFETVKKAPFLILDDFGEQFSTPWAREKLYQVLNYRYNARLPTVITTSLRLEDMEARISSRIQDPRVSFVWTLDVPSYRAELSGAPPVRRRPPGRSG
jgi:DNA replication protein DnaC